MMRRRRNNMHTKHFIEKMKEFNVKLKWDEAANELLMYERAKSENDEDKYIGSIELDKTNTFSLTFNNVDAMDNVLMEFDFITTFKLFASEDVEMRYTDVKDLEELERV